MGHSTYEPGPGEEMAADGEPICGACDDCLAPGVGLICTRPKHTDKRHIAHVKGRVYEGWDDPSSFSRSDR